MSIVIEACADVESVYVAEPDDMFPHVSKITNRGHKNKERQEKLNSVLYLYIIDNISSCECSSF